MIIIAVITLMVFFGLGSISPLLLADDTEQIVELESRERPGEC